MSQKGSSIKWWHLEKLKWRIFSASENEKCTQLGKRVTFDVKWSENTCRNVSFLQLLTKVISTTAVVVFALYCKHNVYDVRRRPRAPVYVCVTMCVFLQNHAFVCLKAVDLLSRLWAFCSRQRGLPRNEEQVCCDMKGHAVGGLHLSQLHSITVSLPLPVPPNNNLHWSFLISSLLLSVLCTFAWNQAVAPFHLSWFYSLARIALSISNNDHLNEGNKKNLTTFQRTNSKCAFSLLKLK